jgi:hypothetical protein
MYDEFLIDPPDWIRLIGRRRLLLLASLVCSLPIAWCRHHQLVQDRAYFRRGFEASTLSLLAGGFRLRAHVDVHLARKRRLKTRRGT